MGKQKRKNMGLVGFLGPDEGPDIVMSSSSSVYYVFSAFQTLSPWLTFILFPYNYFQLMN